MVTPLTCHPPDCHHRPLLFIIPCTYCVYYEFLFPHLFHLSVHALVAAWQVSHGAVLYEGKKTNNQTMPLFLLCQLKGSWLSLNAAACWPVRLTTLQAAHPIWGTGKRHRCFVSNTSFLDPFCTNTHSTWAPTPHTPCVCPPPFRHCNRSLSMLSQPIRQGSTRVKYRDCNTHLAHCNYSCLGRVHTFLLLCLFYWTESVATYRRLPPIALPVASEHVQSWCIRWDGTCCVQCIYGSTNYIFMCSSLQHC